MRNKWLLLETRYKIIIIVCAVLILGIIIGLGLYIAFPKEEDVQPSNELPPMINDVEEDTNNENDEDENKDNDDTVPIEPTIKSIYIRTGTVVATSPITKTTTFTVNLDSDNEKKEVKGIANNATLFYNIDAKTSLSVQNVAVGDKVIMYMDGEPEGDTYNLLALCIGSDTSYYYDVIGNRSEDYTVFTLKHSDVILNVTDDTIVYNGIVGGIQGGIIGLHIDGIILYKSNSEPTVTENGISYVCDEVVILDTGNPSK